MLSQTALKILQTITKAQSSYVINNLNVVAYSLDIGSNQKCKIYQQLQNLGLILIYATDYTKTGGFMAIYAIAPRDRDTAIKAGMIRMELVNTPDGIDVQDY